MRSRRRRFLPVRPKKIEEMLWFALRMFEERKNLLNRIANSARGAKGATSARDRAKEMQQYIERIRSMLLEPDSLRAEDARDAFSAPKPKDRSGKRHQT
jgi:two-component system chemotaxis response regulator CheB